MKKASFLIVSLLLIGNVASAAVTKNSSKAELLAEIEKLKAENESLKSKVEVKTTEVEATKGEIDTIKTELVETKKKVPVIEPGHERDNKWVNFNLISAQGLKGGGEDIDDTYLEIKLGGRKGIFDFWGYVDFYDALGDSYSGYNEGSSDKTSHKKTNFFSELHPRMSIDGLLNKDLSIGPVKEWYVAGYMKSGDTDLNTKGLGIGTDLKVPWFGIMPLNLYALYVEEDFNSTREGKWDGYLVKTSWMKSLYKFENGSYLAYQGYMNYAWDQGYDSKKDSGKSDDEFQWYNGLFWHNKDFALGYALKYVKDMRNFTDGAENKFADHDNESTGFEHHFTATYKW